MAVEFGGLGLRQEAFGKALVEQSAKARRFFLAESIGFPVVPSSLVVELEK
jgi:hypothetical protein